MSGRKAWGLVLLAAHACAAASCAPDPPDPPEVAAAPDIVLVLTDDQRYDTLGCTGSDVVATPELDRLAAEGALFTRAYVVTSLCCPARASLLTGKYAHATGVTSNEDHPPVLEEQLGLGEALRRVGYRTGFFGKWHVENPGAAPLAGFDRWVGFEGQGRYFDETYNVDGTPRRIDGYSIDVLTDLALEWLALDDPRPSFAIVSVKNLHRPSLPAPRHADELASTSFPAPAIRERSARPVHVERVGATLRNMLRPNELAQREQAVRGYHQLVLSVDDNVGRLLRAIDERGESADTLFLMTSDGGYLWGEHGLYKKRVSYEPSIRVPLLVRWPREIAAGTRIDLLALNVDVFPTLLDVAGAEIPDDVHGNSLRPLWSGGDTWRERFLYLDAWSNDAEGPLELALVGERYKYVRYRSPLEERLYDRENDADEVNDLSSSPEHAALLETARSGMRAELASLGAPASWFAPLD